MSQLLSRRAVLPLLAAAIAGAGALPAAACTVGWPFKAGKPFSDAYFDAGVAVFRGKAIRYKVSGFAAEITFAVQETYSGERRDFWHADWANSTFGVPNDLAAFQQEIGEDLVVVVDVIGRSTVPTFALPHEVVQTPCHEPAMQTFEVMEALLRERGYIQ